MADSQVSKPSATLGVEVPVSEYVVYFLDALGFRQYVTENPAAAIGIIEDINDTVRIAVQDHSRQAQDKTLDEAVRFLAERHSVTAFEYLIPFSDSIFLLSKEPSLSVFQVSHLLVSALQRRLNAFAYPDHDGDVRDVPVKTFDFVRSMISEDIDRWYPVLMRGGAAYGEAHPLRVESLAGGEAYPVHGAAGPAVVEAVGLEEQGKERGKGPRVRCSPRFADQLSGEAAEYVGECYDDPSAQEIYWPMALFETEPECSTGLPMRLTEPLRAAFRLWAQFVGGPVGLQYAGLMKLLVESARRRYPGKGDDVERFVTEQTSMVCGETQAVLVREILFG